MLYDICYYVVDVPEVGIVKGRHVDDRPAGASWQPGETTGALSVLEGAEMSQDDLDNFRGWKWLLVPGKNGKWKHALTDTREWKVQPDDALEVEFPQKKAEKKAEKKHVKKEKR